MITVRAFSIISPVIDCRSVTPLDDVTRVDETIILYRLDFQLLSASIPSLSCSVTAAVRT